MRIAYVFVVLCVGFVSGPSTAQTVRSPQPTNATSETPLILEKKAPGKQIEAHRHPEADEILFLQKGTARVHLGDSVRVVHADATVFIPADTWIQVENTQIGKRWQSEAVVPL
jgi:mannose-6-phosphate isomerase-like protein (cupin superfamily)